MPLGVLAPTRDETMYCPTPMAAFPPKRSKASVQPAVPMLASSRKLPAVTLPKLSRLLMIDALPAGTDGPKCTLLTVTSSVGELNGTAPPSLLLGVGGGKQAEKVAATSSVELIDERRMRHGTLSRWRASRVALRMLP